MILAELMKIKLPMGAMEILDKLLSNSSIEIYSTKNAT
jgi:hypothetical protein